MIVLKTFTIEDWRALDEYPTTAKWRGRISEAHIEGLAAQKYSYSAFKGDKLLGCGGVVDLGGGRGEAWAMLHRDLVYDFLEIQSLVRRYFEVCPFDRIEAIVECDHIAAHRWVKSLGFQCEAPKMRKYLMGVDHALYARIR